MTVAAKTYVHRLMPDAANREKDDFYPTPAAGTHALLSVESFEGRIKEPACGDGAISRVLLDNGYQVESSDLVDRGYGQSRIDYLMDFSCADNVVTNPPFKLAEQFVRHALDRTDRKVAMLLRLSWLEGSGRRVLFESTPLARVWVFSKRLTMHRSGVVTGGGSGMVAFAWFVWEQGYTGSPVLGWIDPVEPPA